MESKHLKPIYIKEYNIYDILYNDMNQLVIIMAAETDPYKIYYVSRDNTLINIDLYKCPHHHIYIYTLNIEYNDIIELQIDNTFIETDVNRYPSFKGEIIFSTMVKNEDNYIKQWINYYLNIGVTRFIIYDNSGINDGLSYCSLEKTSNLSLVLKEYIEKNIVLLIKWPYPKRLKKSGISGQSSQQNHSIYTFRESKYIGLFDIDEYINIKNKSDINSFLENVIINKNLNTNDISSFQFLCKLFYNPKNLPTDGDNFFKIFNCREIIEKGRQKCIVIPKNVITFRIHHISKGKPMISINKTMAYFNHYFFLNKNRGRQQASLIDDSILSIIKRDHS